MSDLDAALTALAAAGRFLMRLPPEDWVLTGLTAVASAADLRHGTVPNGLIAGGVGCAVLSAVSAGGMPALLRVSAGAALPLILLWPLYRIRTLGAGDVKLLAVAGAFLGPERMCGCLAAVFVSGGILALLLLLVRGNARERMKVLADYIADCAEQRRVKPYPGLHQGNALMHFTVPIFAGVLWTVTRCG